MIGKTLSSLKAQWGVWAILGTLIVGGWTAKSTLSSEIRAEVRGADVQMRAEVQAADALLRLEIEAAEKRTNERHDKDMALVRDDLHYIRETIAPTAVYRRGGP